MHITIVALLALGFAAVAAVPANPQRIVGGSLTTIARYPSIVAMLFNNGNAFRQACGGTILTRRTIVTAAHCVHGDPVARWRIRVGSSMAHSGGVVHPMQIIQIHHNYNRNTLDSDIALMRTSTVITFRANAVAPVRYAGPAYVLGDNAVVWAAGWGRTSVNGPSSEQLRHVQIWTINQATCRSRYAAVSLTVTANMLCSGTPSGGRDQCAGDSGGPLLHNNVLVGVCSWGRGCAQARFPGVNTRVSRFGEWMHRNAIN